MLRWRAATALVLAPIALASIALGKWAMIAVLLVVIAGAAYELSRALEPLPFLAALGAGALPLLLSIPYRETWRTGGRRPGLPWALIWLAGQARDEDAARRPRRTPHVALGRRARWRTSGCSPAPSYGVVLILIAVVGPWISDAGAYFAGRFFGRQTAVPDPEPEQDRGGWRRRPPVDGPDRRPRRPPAPRLYDRQGPDHRAPASPCSASAGTSSNRP